MDDKKNGESVRASNKRKSPTSKQEYLGTNELASDTEKAVTKSKKDGPSTEKHERAPAAAISHVDIKCYAHHKSVLAEDDFFTGGSIMDFSDENLETGLQSDKVYARSIDSKLFSDLPPSDLSAEDVITDKRPIVNFEQRRISLTPPPQVDIDNEMDYQIKVHAKVAKRSPRKKTNTSLQPKNKPSRNYNNNNNNNNNAVIDLVVQPNQEDALVNQCPAKTYRIKINDHFGKILTDYCKRASLNRADVLLRYNGVSLSEYVSPFYLKLSPNSEIEITSYSFHEKEEALQHLQLTSMDKVKNTQDSEQLTSLVNELNNCSDGIFINLKINLAGKIDQFRIKKTERIATLVTKYKQKNGKNIKLRYDGEYLDNDEIIDSLSLEDEDQLDAKEIA